MSRTRAALVAALGLASLLAACDVQDPGPVGDYESAATVSEGGFARRGMAIDPAGGDVALWGYVDPGNVYGDKVAREILQQWWGGEGPGEGLWRFDLKARAEDETGQGFAVWIPDDEGRDALLRRFADDARAGRATRVFLRGRLFAFEAPVNAASRQGLQLELAGSEGVRFAPASPPDAVR